MTERNTKALGLGTIIAILLVTVLGLGILLGLFGKKLGIPDNVGGATVGVIVGYLTATLVHRRQKAIGRD
ncbi:MAG: hypothetical protein GEU99_13000 [Luteitalea sp.]|nr:hypothetical protein [Luteitalea sp.]